MEDPDSLTREVLKVDAVVCEIEGWSVEWEVYLNGKQIRPAHIPEIPWLENYSYRQTASRCELIAALPESC